MIWEALGAQTAQGFWGRLTNEVVHNLLGGATAGYLTWRFVLMRRGVLARSWIPFIAAAMVLGGLIAWGMEASLGTETGDAAPLAMLAFGLISGFAYRRLPSVPTPALEPTTPVAAVP